MIVYTTFSLHLENKFTLKKSSTIADLLMKKPSNWVGIAKKVRITPEEGNFKKNIILFISSLFNLEILLY